MPLSSVLGQPRALEVLRASLKGGTVHHAYLFDGPDGVGKEFTALGFAQALLCPKQPGEGCGTCATCGRVGRRNHPDVTWVMPEEQAVSRGAAGRSDFANTPSRDIKVEQIRALQERLSLRALEGTRKLAVLVSAERLNPQAQNAFLKTLEEPPAGTTLILISSASELLLPTIRSRCARIQFAPLPVELLAARLEKERELDGPTARLVATMAGGSLSRAISLDVEGLAERAEIIRRFEELEAGGPPALLAFAESYGRSREDAEDALRVLAVWVRDLAAISVGQPAINADLTELATQRAAKVPAVRLHRWNALLEEAMESITTRNGGPRLQLERMLIEMAG